MPKKVVLIKDKGKTSTWDDRTSVEAERRAMSLAELHSAPTPQVISNVTGNYWLVDAREYYTSR